MSIIIVSEGAIDISGQPITANQVKEVWFLIFRNLLLMLTLLFDNDEQLNALQRYCDTSVILTPSVVTDLLAHTHS